ncbi:hypothetical protein PAPYR_7404 [Paratrimastix pyriformis]|uniref:Uncharacterized protein n=1 Tax=Paratrimastix pyriformis TaxID=342808 RepID=A0ABQ8UGG3_9EUKA|nr:hypothetical protein PAPYR_7404 [Paratrimastix pyriformis]
MRPLLLLLVLPPLFSVFAFTPWELLFDISNPQTSDQTSFGSAVSFSTASETDIILVASARGNTGRVFTFQCDASTRWNLRDPEPLSGADPTSDRDSFGAALALFPRGTVLAVGAPTRDSATQVDVGAVDLYEAVSGDSGVTKWNKTASLFAPFTVTELGLYGQSLSCDESRIPGGWRQTLVVGAPGMDRVFLYERLTADEGGSHATSVPWELVMVLSDPLCTSNRSCDFGDSVSLSGDLLSVGGPTAYEGSVSDWGAAFVFARCATCPGGWNATGERVPGPSSFARSATATLCAADVRRVPFPGDEVCGDSFRTLVLCPGPVPWILFHDP